jgi:hypothetical protein
MRKPYQRSVFALYQWYKATYDNVLVSQSRLIPSRGVKLQYKKDWRFKDNAFSWRQLEREAKSEP